MNCARKSWLRSAQFLKRKELFYSYLKQRIDTEEPRNSAFQGTCGFYALLREMPYCQYIELKEKASRDLEFMLL